MNTKKIIHFLKGIAANNNKQWFQEHKAEYDEVKADFENGVDQIISCLATFDDEVSHLTAKDCTYRFYRDIRFSPDKSPYKRHLGAYICARGRKALRGGYYIHLEPGNCLVAVGCYWLPTNILTSCRNEIMANIDEWRKDVENEDFLNLFGRRSIVNFSFGISTLLRCCPQLTNTKHVKNIKILFFILQFNITVSALYLVVDNCALPHNQY